jgi:predicted RNA-binding Zn ribbon-like protein
MRLLVGGFMKMAKDPDFLFLGGRLCLDFVNTEIVVEGKFLDLLSDFRRWMAWHSAVGGQEMSEAKALAGEWGGKSESIHALARAVSFRSELRKMAGCVASHKRVPESAVGAINELLRLGPAYGQLIPVGRGFVRQAHRDVREPVDLLVPVAEDAADLLCEGDQGRVRKCGSPACVLFFYDTSKSRTRRWCSMDLCGNRAKVAAHYRRKRARRKLHGVRDLRD